MLIASDPIVLVETLTLVLSSAFRWLVRADFHRPAVRRRRRSRQELVPAQEPFPSAWRFRDRFLPAFLSRSPLCRSIACTVPVQPLETDLLTARLSLHLRFAMLVPGNAQGWFSDAAAGIAARSIRLNFPFPFSSFLPWARFDFTALMTKSCAPKVSRASRILQTYPQGDESRWTTQRVTER